MLQKCKNGLSRKKRVTEVRGSEWFNEVIGDLSTGRSRNHHIRTPAQTYDGGQDSQMFFSRLAQPRPELETCERLIRLKRKTLATLGVDPDELKISDFAVKPSQLKSRKSSPLWQPASPKRRIPSPLMRRLKQAQEAIKAAHVGLEGQRRTIFLPGMLINNKVFAKIRIRSSSQKKAKDHFAKLRGEVQQKQSLKQAFRRLIRSDEGDILLTDFILQKKFIKKSVLTNYLLKLFPADFVDRLLTLLELQSPNINLKKFGEMNTNFNRSIRRLKRLAFSFFDRNGDGFVCIKDVFLVISEPGSLDLYDDILAIVKALNKKGSKQYTPVRRTNGSPTPNHQPSEPVYTTPQKLMEQNMQSILSKKMHDTFSNFCADLHQSIQRHEKLVLRTLGPIAKVPDNVKKEFSLDQTFDTYMREKQYQEEDQLSFEEFCKVPFQPFYLPMLLVKVGYYLFDYQFPSIRLTPTQVAKAYRELEDELFSPPDPELIKKKHKRISEIFEDTLKKGKGGGVGGMGGIGGGGESVRIPFFK